MSAAMVTMSVNAQAQGLPNQDTYFTFSQAVELPKTTLPAGTYFFQLMDSNSNRHIVKVMSQDKKELKATLLAIPFYSNDRPSDKPEVRFMETPATASATPTNAVKIWFYPGNTVGHEFIYPRAQAMQIASRTGQSVLTTKTEADDAELTRVDASGTDAEATVVAQAAPEAAPVTEPAPEPVREPVGAISGTDSTPAPMPERTADVAPRTDLPHTAGMLPLLALMGFGSLAGSQMLRRARQ
jgi:hypothetical protein